jgi:hypothetical protein
MCCGVNTFLYCLLLESYLQSTERCMQYNYIYNNNKTIFLEQVVQAITTTWTTGGRLGVLFTSPLKRHGTEYSEKSVRPAASCLCPVLTVCRCWRCQSARDLRGLTPVATHQVPELKAAADLAPDRGRRLARTMPAVLAAGFRR